MLDQEMFLGIEIFCGCCLGQHLGSWWPLQQVLQSGVPWSKNSIMVRAINSPVPLVLFPLTLQRPGAPQIPSHWF